MNPLTNIRNQNKINERELLLGFTGCNNKSWHQKYADSAWIYVGSLPYDLNEGDIISVFSQYGEIVNINLIRDRKTGKSRGFAFVCYEDQRSTILAVDNLNGIKLLKRTIRVDHVEKYKIPKYYEDIDEETRCIWEEGCAPKPVTVGESGSEEETDPVEKMKEKGTLDKDGIIKVDRALRKKLKKEQKRLKKKAKEAEKKEKRLRRKLEKEELELRKETPENASWKDQKKLIDLGSAKEEEIYGGNEHFNFGKPKKEFQPPPVHNPRPDFEKADWREIEMWKAVREKEKQEKGEKETNWKEEEHYLPSRFRKD